MNRNDNGFDHGPGSPDPERIQAAGATVAGGAVGALVAIVVGHNGATEPSLGSRTPELLRILGQSDTTLSLGLAGIAVGLLFASTFSGALVDRMGTRRTMRLGALITWGSFMTIGWIAGVGLVEIEALDAAFPIGLACAAFTTGAGFAILNSASFRISTWNERQQARAGGSGRLENQLTHAGYSAGSLIGALLGLGAVRAGVPLNLHLAAVGAVALIVTFVFVAPRVPDLKGGDLTRSLMAGQTQTRVRGSRMELRGAAIVGAAASFAVVIGFNWSGILLSRLGATDLVATFGVIAYAFTSGVTRLIIRQISRRRLKRPVRLTRISGIGAIAALALIAGSGTVELTIAGFALLGAALASVTPLVQSVADRLSAGREGRGVALTQRYAYVGLLLGGGVGLLSDAFGSAVTAEPLRLAIGALVVCPLVIIALAGCMRSARRAD